MLGPAVILSLGGVLLQASLAGAVAVYGQCGGTGYTGSTTCDTGSVCTYVNAYYSQCLPGTATTTSTTAKAASSSVKTSSTTVKTSSSSTKATSTTKTASSTTTSSSSTGLTCSGTRTKFKYFGVNESGAEFGTAIPGVLGTDYTWPSPSSVDYFMNLGFNTFRIPFLMERLSPVANGLTGSFDATYLAGLTSIATYITGKGGYALLDPHNYMRYNGAIITSTSDFATWWSHLSAQFKSNANIVFDIQNEPYGIDATTVYSLNQAAVNAIRAGGATSQLILVEGTSWTGAWTWISSGNAAAFATLSDPNNNIAIEMHQYLDSDGSGTSDQCVSGTIGAERIAAATTWLQQTGYKGFLGETAGGSNSLCIQAIYGELCAMQQSGVWIGALWWAAGPWWGDYIYSIEPPSGPALQSVLPQALEPFL